MTATMLPALPLPVYLIILNPCFVPTEQPVGAIDGY